MQINLRRGKREAHFDGCGDDAQYSLSFLWGRVVSLIAPIQASPPDVSAMMDLL